MDERSVRSIRTLASPSGARVMGVMNKSTAPIADKAPVCSACGDSGWREVASGDDRRVTRCECFLGSRADRLLTVARIPARYEHCELEGYEPGSNPSLVSAKMTVCNFIQQYPLDRTGLMFRGSIGVGKTHLAVATIKELIRAKNVPCVFCEYRELLKRIQDSYNPAAETTELEVLRPVFETEVLVLDELGAVKPSQWVWDTVSFILNTRYNDNRTTIITTNLLDEASLGVLGRPSGMREDSLGDRIGERMRSRIHEMCRTVKMDGEDFRERFRSNAMRSRG